MVKLNSFIISCLIVTSSITSWIQPAHAGPGAAYSTNSSGGQVTVPTYYANSPAGTWTDSTGQVHNSGTALRKFVDALPKLGAINSTPTLGQYIPTAVPDTTAYPNSDYYEIGIVEYAEKMHSDLPKPTTLRGYVQLETPANAGISKHVALKYPDGTPILDGSGNQIYAVDNPHYLGPFITATKGTPIRVKYSNLLPKGHFDAGTGQRNGDLFLPVDETLMGAGVGPDGVNKYTQNRAMIHLHGGDTPWISDGTPHQWIAPAGENTPYMTGASFQNVPDMPDPGAGSATLYYPNNQSARMLFYHDHTVGITRLNVYAGLVSGYLITDSTEKTLTDSGAIPSEQIPLVIQEKIFVPQDIAVQDAKWDTTHWGQPGDLWFPHVYEPNQDPNSFDGTNPVGRWDWGPWFWPVFPAPDPLPTGVYGDVSSVPETFGDTPLVNGTAYPTLTVDPKAYRFRVLNGSNDRYFNLGLYTAVKVVAGCTVSNGGTGYNPATTTVSFTGGLDPAITNGQPATATATINGSGAITGIALSSFGSGYLTAPVVTITDTSAAGTGAAATCTLSGQTEVAMVPFDSSATFPSTGGLMGTGWGTPDARVGGVPSPATIGPPIIQIGSEGGFLPNPVVIPSTPINYEYNKRSVTVLNVLERGFYIGPAERADTIIDFSQYAGKTLILYNDAPAPLPAGDSRIDYYTGDPDQTPGGGAATTLPGYGPNTRTIMQIKVNATLPGGGTPVAFDPTVLNTALPAAYAAAQPKPVVAESAYNNALGTSAVDTYARIFTGSATQHTFDFPAGDTLSYVPEGATTPVTVAAGQTAQIPVLNKAIQELFDTHGRMNATLGVEIPYTSSLTQTTIPLGYIDPATESISDGETQIWKITHNGVDTHPVHFHLVNVQLINRVGWDGTVKPPDDNEVGWKETIKMNPLEDIIVAVRAKQPQLPGFGISHSVRRLNPSDQLNSAMGFTQVSPTTGNPATVTNVVSDFGWEYVWHCHILGHEENDFMRPFVFIPTDVKAVAPTLNSLGVSANGASATLEWSDNSSNEFQFLINRAAVTVGGVVGPYSQIGTALANATTYTDATLTPGTTYSYTVVANAVKPSDPSNALKTQTTNIPAAPTTFVATATSATGLSFTWTANTANVANFLIQYRESTSNQWISLPLVAVGGTTASVSNTLATPVAPSTSYIAQIVAVNATGGASLPTAAAAVTTPAANVSIVSVQTTSTTATVIWDNPIPGTTGVSIQRSGAAPVALAVGATSYIDAGLTPNTVYNYTITVTSAAPPATATTSATTTPVAVTGLASTSGSTSITLSWTNTNGTPNTVTVQRTGAAAVTLAGTTLSYQDTGLTPNTPYTYTVTVNGANGTAATTLAATTAPMAVLNLTVSAVTSTSTTLTWSNTNIGTATAVSIQRAGAAAVALAANATSYTDTGLTPNTTYNYTVTLTGTGGMAASPATPATTAPAALTGITAAATDTTATLAWTNPNPGTTTISVQRGTGAAVTLPAGSLSYTDTGLAPTTLYTYTLVVTGTNGTASATASATTSTPAVPFGPSGLTLSANVAGQVTLGWTDKSDNETGFQLQRCTGASTVCGATTATWSAITQVAANVVTAADTTVASAITYTYRVVALNANANPVLVSVPSNLVEVTTLTSVAAPSNLTATATATRVALSWTDNANNETQFQIFRSTNGGAVTQIGTAAARTGTGRTQTYTDTTVTLGNTYQYYVTAVYILNSPGLPAPLNSPSPHSNAVSVNFAGASAPASVSAVAGAAGSRSATVSWTMPAGSGTPTSFTIQRSTLSRTNTWGRWTTVTTAAATATSFTNTRLTAGTTYRYQVRANSALGNSAFTVSPNVVAP